MKDWRKEILTIPNLLSLFRLLMIPVYVVVYLQADAPADYVLAAAILAISCLTDMIDGQIARRFNMISTFGKLLDPVADKATQFSLLVCLAVEFPVLLTLLTLFLIKEGFQFIAMWIAYRHGKMLRGALISGKVSTAVLFLSLITMVLFHETISLSAVRIITCVDGILMLIAFLHYVFTYWKETPMIQDITET